MPNNKLPLYLKLFLFCMLSRCLFLLYLGPSENETFGDAIRYDILSNKILNGNHNMDLTAFIVAPLYPYTLALFKLISPLHWNILILIYQFGLISLSTIYIYKISYLISRSDKASLLASIIYILNPMTLWFNTSFSQETSFQAFFIFFIYYFLKFLKHQKLKSYILSFTFLALAYLTKSHIIILFPLLLIVAHLHTTRRYLMMTGISIFILMLPQMSLNKNIYNTWGLSNFAFGSMLLAGHSQETYPCLTSKLDKSDLPCNLNLIFHPPYDFPEYGQINLLPLNERNNKRIQMAWNWIKKNPRKFIILKLNAFYRFVMPGVDGRVYDRRTYWICLILGIAIYLPAYFQTMSLMKTEKAYGHFILSIIGIIFFLFVIMYPQHRFRVITLEPLFICLAAIYYITLIKKEKLSH